MNSESTAARIRAAWNRMRKNPKKRVPFLVR